MSLFMKCLAVVVLILGVIGAIVYPLTLFSVLLETCIGFGLLYSFGEMLSLLQKIRDTAKEAGKGQKETNDMLRTIIQAREQNIASADKEPAKDEPKEEKKQEKAPEKGCEYVSGKAIKVDENTIKCPFCGKLQKEDRSFCFYCSAKFERE